MELYILTDEETPKLLSSVPLVIINTLAQEQDITVFASLDSKQIHFRTPFFYEKWLDLYLEEDFLLHFRMTRKNVDILLHHVSQVVEKTSNHGGVPVIPLEKCLLITIWYLAKNHEMRTVGSQFNVAAASVYNAISLILNGLKMLRHIFIKWPTANEYHFITQEFLNNGGYPNVIGAIDGSHVKCQVPFSQHDSYQDRHFHHSITLQGICTSSKIFTDISVGWPGSMHDSRVSSDRFVHITMYNFAFNICYLYKKHLYFKH